MASRFGWLDADDTQRAQMMEIVKLFQDQGSVDELGIGAIRDAFSNSFFPGTSVLHTRARYLLFVPWLLGDVARNGQSLDASRAAFRDGEVRLIRALLKGGEDTGVIGSQRQEKLKTMPSQIYWPALQRLGIVRWTRSIDGHLRSAVQRVRQSTEVGSADSASGATDLGLDASLPSAPDGWLNETTFDLGQDEADALRSVLAKLGEDNLLGWLAANSDTVAGDRIWQHPDLGRFPDELRARVDHARRLHYVWHGAPLLYNLMLARLVDDDARIAEYEKASDSWLTEVRGERVLDGWARDEFWAVVRQLNPRLGPPTVAFVDEWIDLVEAGDHAGERAQNLVRSRELKLKGRRSRLHHADARAGWSGYAGLAALDYRWAVARRFLGDIFDGLNRGVG